MASCLDQPPWVPHAISTVWVAILNPAEKEVRFPIARLGLAAIYDGLNSASGADSKSVNARALTTQLQLILSRDLTSGLISEAKRCLEQLEKALKL